MLASLLSSVAYLLAVASQASLDLGPSSGPGLFYLGLLARTAALSFNWLCFRLGLLKENDS